MWTSVPATMARKFITLFERLVIALERIAQALEDQAKH